jgi:histidinol-phosphatase (PHP family)
MTLTDLHVHSTCSADGASTVAEHALQAEALGLGEVGFAEHVDLDPRDQDYGFLDLAGYDREIATARALVPGVRLRKGVEIAYQAFREDEIRQWLSAQSWDFVVASVHMVDYADGWAIVSEPRSTESYFSRHSARQAYLPYFEELLRAAQSGLADVLGHLDLVKRYGEDHYGPFEPAHYEDEIRAVLQALVDSGMGLEINTSGLRQRPGEPYPGLRVLRWYRQLGGEILTTGSDAHHIDDLGAGISKALTLARMAGFRAVATLHQRQIHWVDISR